MELLIVAGITIAVIRLYQAMTAGTARPSSRPALPGYVVTEFARQKRRDQCRSEFTANEYLGGRK